MIPRGTFHLFLAAIVVTLLSSPPTPAQSQERAPTELWQQFPLDPRSGQKRADPQEPPALTRAKPVRRVEVRETGADAARTAAEDDRSSWLVLLSLALIAAGVVGVAIRTLQILSAFRAKRRPMPSLVEQVRSETGSLVPHAPPRRQPARGRQRSGARPTQRPPHSVAPAPEEKPVERGLDERRLHAEERPVDTAGKEEPEQPAEPASQEEPVEPARQEEPAEAAREEEPARAGGRKPVVRAGAPPRKKHVPGLSPPPGKERKVASGLPPGKRPRPEPPPQVPAPGPAPGASRPPRTNPAWQPRGLKPAASPRARAWEECEIDLWHGYTTSDFYALAMRADGEIYVAARSPSFRWLRSEPPPEAGGAAKAHAALRKRLAAEGWEPTARGPVWYMTRFHRRPTPTLRELARGAEPGAF
jgi:hypothetical protein